MVDNTVRLDGVYSFLKPAIMTYPVLFEPKAYIEDGKPKGEPKFSSSFIFDADSEDLKAIKTLSAKLARTLWPDKPFFLTTQEGIKIRQVVFPWQDGTEIADKRVAKGKKDDGGTRGKVLIAAKSKNAPRLSIIKGASVIDLNDEASIAANRNKFYAGALVIAEINLCPYEAKGQTGLPGVTAYLNRIGVLDPNPGVRMAAGHSGGEAFRGYVGSVSAENPMGPGADANIDDLL